MTTATIEAMPAIDADLLAAAVQLQDVALQRAAALSAVTGAEVPALGDLEDRCSALVSRMHEGDSEARRAVFGLAWPTSDPDAQWWGTPLGVVAALSDPSGMVPVRRAAMVLGVRSPRVSQLRDAGVLHAHPDGGVTAASVAARRYSDRGRA